jgi:hypothetical protein
MATKGTRSHAMGGSEGNNTAESGRLWRLPKLFPELHGCRILRSESHANAPPVRASSFDAPSRRVCCSSRGGIRHSRTNH